MGKMIKISRVLVLCLILICGFSSFSRPVFLSQDSIMLEGSIYNNTDRVRKAVIRIYKKNKVIKTVKVRSSNKFNTYLPVNAFLTIEIDAPGFHKKRFIFDSHVPENLNKLPSYEFDMDIFTEKELEGVNTSLLDFPAGLVQYSERKKEFVHNKDYTKQMKKEYYRLLEEAKMSDRTTLETE